MCLYSTNQPQIAKEDIVCYKWLTKRLLFTTSPFRWFNYFRYRKYKTKLTFMRLISYPFIDEYNQGFHSFQSIEAAQKSPFSFCDNAHIYKCIIPKGATYVKGDQFIDKEGNIDDTQQYVSNQIIIKNCIK